MTEKDRESKAIENLTQVNKKKTVRDRENSKAHSIAEEIRVSQAEKDRLEHIELMKDAARRKEHGIDADGNWAGGQRVAVFGPNASNPD